MNTTSHSFTSGTVVLQRQDNCFRFSDVVHSNAVTLTEHVHERASLNLVLCGTYPERSEFERDYIAGHLIYKPPLYPHSNNFTDDTVRSLVIELSTEVFENLCSHDSRFVEPWHLYDATASRQAQRLCYHVLTDETEVSTASALAFELLGYATNRPIPRQVSWLQQVIDLIMSEYARTPTILELSTLAGLSPTHFARAFRQATGHTPGEVIRARRVAATLELLAQGQLTGVEIALEVGFSDESHMIRTVRRTIQASPAIFRTLCSR